MDQIKHINSKSRIRSSSRKKSRSSLALSVGTEAGLGCGQAHTSALSAVTIIPHCIGRHKYSALYRPSQIFRIVSAVTNIPHCIGRCQAEHENGMHKTRQNDITTTLNFFGRFTGQRFRGIGILHLCLSQIPLVAHVCSTGHGSPPKR